MSGLYERWHELSKRGGLDLAGCQMLGDWKKEADQLRAQLQQSHEREAALRESLAHVSEMIDDMDRDGDDELHQIQAHVLGALMASPSQPSRYREMEAVVKAARKYVSAMLSGTEIDKADSGNVLYAAVKDLDKAREGAG